MKKTLIITFAALMFLATLALAQGMGMGQRGDGRFDCDGSMRMMGPGGKGMPNPGCDGIGRHGQRGFGHSGSGEPGAGILLNLKDELELTQAQVDQIKKLMNDFALGRIDHRAELEKARVKLRTLMNDDASEAEVNTAIDEVAGLEAEMQKMRFSHQKQIQAVLTDAQKEKLEQFRQQRNSRLRDRWDTDDDDRDNFRPGRGRI
ncbi:MAG: Spy/CpxP family protein refolding chaperone [Candidatus Zixiibacteriota bacterium]